MEVKGLPFFFLETHLNDDFDLVEAEYGLKGFAVVVKLYQKIYGERGYYCEWTNDVALRFSRLVNEGCSAVSEIVGASIRRGLFDRDMFERYGILTSRGVQNQYLKAVSRRTNISVKEEYLLIDVNQIPKNVNIISKNVDSFKENASNFGQRREEKKRIEKNREEERSKEVPPAAQKLSRHKYGFYKNVLLSDGDMEKLKKEFPNDYQNRIERLSEYIASSGKSYKNHLATIRMWAKKDKEAKQRKAEEKKPKVRASAFNNYVDDNAGYYEELEANMLNMMLDDDY